MFFNNTTDATAIVLLLSPLFKTLRIQFVFFFAFSTLPLRPYRSSALSVFLLHSQSEKGFTKVVRFSSIEYTFFITATDFFFSTKRMNKFFAAQKCAELLPAIISKSF